MAVKKSLSGKASGVIESKPKKTLQGKGTNTKCAATSRNKASKRYRGQGNQKGLGELLINGSRTQSKSNKDESLNN